MIPVPSGVRVWLASGVTDMRRGMNTLALQVQEDLGRDPRAGDLFVFRGRKGDLIKMIWWDGQLRQCRGNHSRRRRAVGGRGNTRAIRHGTALNRFAPRRPEAIAAAPINAEPLRPRAQDHSAASGRATVRARTRRQSRPSNKASNWALLSRITPSSIRGQAKRPCSKRL